MTDDILRSRGEAASPEASSVLAVCAHPDDESFGLGAVLAAFTRAGARCSLLCFTQGEASTLGRRGNGGLRQVRAAELAAAAEVLGLERTVLLDYPDGALGAVPLTELVVPVTEQARQSGARMLLVFDEGGVTGHPDHCRATEAALAAAERDDLTVLAWTIPSSAARALNEEFGTLFVGRPPGWIDLTIAADRPLQAAAIACHASQSTDNPVLHRRLELLGPTEHLRVLRRSGHPPVTNAGAHA